jgi:hypothetical protein
MYRFLIEGELGAVLHTGDFRAESWFLESLKRNPFLESYLTVPNSLSRHDNCAVRKQLETIYLDTACMLSAKIIPSKVSLRLKLISYSMLIVS